MKTYETKRNRLLHHYNARNNNARYIRLNQTNVMENSKEKALKFIEVLKAMNLNYLSVDESFSPDLEYSICISGKINTDLFIVKFAKFKTFGKHEMKIYDSTSCKDLINQILKSL